MQWLKLLFPLALIILSAGVRAAPVWPPTPAKQRTVRQGNVVYYLSPSFVLTARNTKTHELLWKTRYNPKRITFLNPVTPKMITAGADELSLLLDHGILYASDYNGMTALRVKDGARVWRGIYPNEVYGPPTIREGVVLTTYESSGAISAGAIQAIDARTGRFLWGVAGVSGFDHNQRRKGYLLCYLDQYLGSNNKAGETYWVNIHTGK